LNTPLIRSLFEKWQNLVDMVIDGGYGDNMGSIDLSGDEPIVVREGKGSLDIYKI
jgi:tRNA A37 threonylcarbamoyladenosine synthetase subunit TsaC/SUA5/YrdC